MDKPSTNEALRAFDRLAGGSYPGRSPADAIALRANDIAVVRAALTAPVVAQGDESPEDRFEHYVQTSIAASPAPLRELGEYLTRVLDEDEWPTAERFLLQLATTPALASLAPERQIVKLNNSAISASASPAPVGEAVGAVMVLRGKRHLSSATTAEQVAQFQQDNPAGWEFAGWLYTTPPRAEPPADAQAVDALVDACRELLTQRVGEQPFSGWLIDNDYSRTQLTRISEALAARGTTEGRGDE